MRSRPRRQRRLRGTEVRGDAAAGQERPVRRTRVARGVHAGRTPSRLAVSDVLRAPASAQTVGGHGPPRTAGGARPGREVAQARGPRTDANVRLETAEGKVARRRRVGRQESGRLGRLAGHQTVDRVVSAGRRGRSQPQAQLFRAVPGDIRDGRRLSPLADRHRVRSVDRSGPPTPTRRVVGGRRCGQGPG